MEWTPEKVYDLIGSLMAAKEKQREELADAQSMGDFVSSYFEQVFHEKMGPTSESISAQKKLSEFAQAVQEHWAHPDLGPRIHMFGLLCGLLLFEGDHPSKLPTGSHGASVHACNLVLDALRAALNGPKFVAPPPPPSARAAGMFSKPWKEPPPPTTPSGLKGGGLVGPPPGSPSSSFSSASSTSGGAFSDYPAQLECALKLRRGGPLACCVTFHRDAVRRAQRCAAVQEYEKERMKTTGHRRHQLQQQHLPPVSQQTRVVRLLGGADDSHLPMSTVEGRLRQVFESLDSRQALPVSEVDALCDTLWGDAVHLRSLVASQFTLKDASDPLANADGLDDPLEAPVQVDRYLLRVLSAWVAFRVYAPEDDGVDDTHHHHTHHQELPQQSQLQLQLQGGGNDSVHSEEASTQQSGMIHGLSAKLDYVGDGSSAGGSLDGEDMDMDQGDGEEDEEGAAEAAARLSSLKEEAAAKREEQRQARAAKREAKQKEKDAAEALANGEVIEYHEASAVAFDWGLAFDGQLREVSFEEARHMYNRIRTRPSITLSVRVLSRPAPLTVRCAPADTVAEVKKRVIQQQQLAHSHGKEKQLGLGSSGALDDVDQSAHVLVQSGVKELAPEATIEACGLHNNASVEMMELKVWRGVLRMKLDQPAFTRSREGTAAAAAATSQRGGRSRRHTSSSGVPSTHSTPSHFGSAGGLAAPAPLRGKRGEGSGVTTTTAAPAAHAGAVDGAALALSQQRGKSPLPRPPVRLVTQVLLGSAHPGGLDLTPPLLRVLVAHTSKAQQNASALSAATTAPAPSSSSSFGKESAALRVGSLSGRGRGSSGSGGGGALAAPKTATASVSNAMEILRLHLRVGDRKWKPPN